MCDEKMLVEKDSYQNNFDLLRLFAALQVVFLHTKNILHIPFDGLAALFPWVIELFPGVQVLFFISGFLLCKSFELNHNLLRYCKNRVLRIYPALYGSFFVSILILLAFDKLYALLEDIYFVPWVLAQLTFLQFYNPAILRGFGVGVLNGSLWTIAVEIQFYVFLPLYNLFRNSFIAKREDFVFALIIIVSSILFFLLQINSEQSGILIKIVRITAFPYLFMFVAGMWMFRRFNLLIKFIEGKVVFWFILYLVFNFKFINIVFGLKYNYFLMIITYFIFCFFILSFAYSFRGFSSKMLRGHDISYGIYLYHMLVVNVFVELSFLYKYEYLFFVYIITVLFGVLSWNYIESKALNLKKTFSYGNITCKE